MYMYVNASWDHEIKTEQRRVCQRVKHSHSRRWICVRAPTTTCVRATACVCVYSNEDICRRPPRSQRRAVQREWSITRTSVAVDTPADATSTCESVRIASRNWSQEKAVAAFSDSRPDLACGWREKHMDVMLEEERLRRRGKQIGCFVRLHKTSELHLKFRNMLFSFLQILSKHNEDLMCNKSLFPIVRAFS